MMLLTYTGPASGLARLYSNALMELKGTFAPVLRPEEVSQRYLPFSEGGGRATVFGLGDPSSTLRVLEALKVAGYEVELFRPPLKGLPYELEGKLSAYPAREVPPDLLQALVEVGSTVLREALEGSDNPRAARIKEDLEDLEIPLTLNLDIDMIIYTNSMEMAAQALSYVTKAPALYYQEALGAELRNKKIVILTTSSEEHWVRGMAVRMRAGLVSLPYDPLVAPLSFVASLRKVIAYTRADNL
ncbi:hypothetical protein [Ignicoccus hospitalis]|uniref:hypothetical protein n=1 Tax=Ignicoccus hospitalis TaxID=160233 RepID=UPI0003223EDD|nr:hypothetical protein [Ignicoccus hospitalis]HIH90308.1 hypothetical protein [Desulfurococcaceae archaeon]